MSRSEWSYWRYLGEVALGMATGWGRLNWYWREFVDGLKAAAFMLGLLILPAFVIFAPLLAFAARASDRRDAQQREKFNREWRQRIHGFPETK